MDVSNSGGADSGVVAGDEGDGNEEGRDSGEGDGGDGSGEGGSGSGGGGEGVESGDKKHVPETRASDELSTRAVMDALKVRAIVDILASCSTEL